MNKILVKSSRGNYPILIGENLLAKSGVLLARSSRKRKVMVVTQKKVARLHLPVLSRSLKRAGFDPRLFYLPDGEAAKSEKELFRMYRTLLDQRFERKDVLFALGGGTVGDVTGFCAATFLRGISFVNAGTTLLAQVDSAIGGKTGINLKEGKNLVGAFYPPELVISDIRTLSTLPPREIRASMAEVVKYGMIRDVRLFRLLESRVPDIFAKKSNVLKKIVLACSRIKAGVVSRDEKETKGERMILNYGHTFGHAFEQALNYKKWMHGEAVAAGMVCAARLAVRCGMFDTMSESRQRELLKRLGLPVSLSQFRFKAQNLIQAMRRDKKVQGGRLTFVLPKAIGRVVVVRDMDPRWVQKVLLEMGCRS